MVRSILAGTPVFWNRDHPFKTSACLRGEGCPHGPMFADARGGGVLGLPTSTIFEIIRDKFQFLIDYIVKIINGEFFIFYHTNKKDYFCLICKNCI